MNQNSLEQFNIDGRVHFLRTLFFSSIVITLCLLFSFASIAYATDNSYTRGGGAKDYGTYSTYSMLLKQGYVSTQNNGELLHVYGSSSFYSDFIRIDTGDYTKTAGTKKLYNITTNFTKNYWLSFYNYNGSTVTFLGNTPIYKNLVDTEIPSRTTFIVINSTEQANGSVYITGDSSNLNSYEYSFEKYSNLWELGMVGDMSYSNGSYSIPVSFGYNIPTLSIPIMSSSVGTKFYYNTQPNTPYVFQNGTAYSIRVVFAVYDSTHKNISAQRKDISAGGSATFTFSDSSARYLKILYIISSGESCSAADFKTLINITGLENETDVVSSSYQLDTSSTGTIVNNYSGSTNSYNITSGDNSPVIVIDGDNNTITLPGSTPIITTPGTPVPLPNEETENEDDDKPWYENIVDALKGLFGGLGSLLDGIIEILFIPINFIIDSVTSLLGLLKGTLESLGGLSEFFSQVFFFLPTPIPEMLTLFIPAILVVAIVKMFL